MISLTCKFSTTCSLPSQLDQMEAAFLNVAKFKHPQWLSSWDPLAAG
eukprot:CAMPEP_0198723664 /NCGR_PEP_ID=MMETSP1475-20131203/1191_1 /TAXON_ID= ORGANISM="Unidentified sp., Strain CCMP1999" /NCGR_SAMPLE_ID=MMETSP1475 /ASSEMBLY_ACC=CAM_ASM_001111 /LENGTH=46 /DNA_ID= /DNA_START= /DNA_END= /DNA_ORIENTATION=